MSELKKKAIPYAELMNIISKCDSPRTQALLSFQYGFGCRAGELAKEYKHYYYRKSSKLTPVTFTSEGAKNKHFNVRGDTQLNAEITFLKPNFKQKKVKRKDKETGEKVISDVDRFTSIVIRAGEPYLFDLIINWVKDKAYDEPIFDLHQAMIRKLIDGELKKYNPIWSSHWLRQSRAWHIGEVTSDIYAVQAVLGHGDWNTSKQYVSGLQRSLRDAFKGGQTMEQLLGRVVE